MKAMICAIAVSCALATTALAKPMVYCSEAAPEGFDGGMFTALATHDAASETLYNRLVEFERGTTQVVPGLAERWDISPDGLEYTFYLRKGVKFHTTEWFTPTRDFNADDVLWTFLRMIDAKHPGAKASPQGWPYASDMEFPTLIKKVEKLGDHTIKFVLSRPESPFIANLGMGFADIVSAEYAQQLEKAGRAADINLKPVGTGPYVFKRYDKGQQIRYEAHPNYWRGKPDNERLIFTIAADGAVRAQKFRAGECHFLAYPNPADIPGLKADPKFTVLQNSALMLSYVAFNTQKPQLKDKRVRQALTYAIDKPAIIQAIFQGNAAPSHLPLPARMWGYNKSIPAYKPDLEKARALLKEAGFEKGFDLNILVRAGGSSGNPNPKLTAEMIQADWKKLGINAKITVMEWVELQKRTKAGEHDITLYGWASDNGDPDNFLSPNLSCIAAESGENRTRWCNKEFDALLDKAKRVTSLKERAQLYEAAQKIFIDEMPWASLAEPLTTVAFQKNVVGFKPSPFNSNNFEKVSVR
ncbi:ABC transporter substrate-binding protein [Parachitinimonas caeni]|uniref:ABC transporter substrate-binding protein n=1 Tax=Parachitinimonas caeni TaxID=3031301 RepID=A0ABT7DWA4_9NEIS|nr:ABC transporter substrate-binding protein [Parachitinimonas caeni]MDK2124341.1 ABC transporter substrate-binding protein [Parachitinimonas caeni]